MPEFTSVRRGMSVALAAMFAAVAPLAGAHAQPAGSRDDTIRTRTLAWPSTDHLFVSLRADVRYVQGPAAKAVITGPASVRVLIVSSRDPAG